VLEIVKLPEGCSGERRYKRGKYLGKGATATVYLFTELQTKQVFACKQFPKKKLARSDAKLKLMQEIKAHRGLKNRNICRFIHCFSDETNVYLLMEYCELGSFQDMIDVRKGLHELEIQYYLP